MEKVFLLGTVFRHAKKSDVLNSLLELARLAETAGGVVAGSGIQSLPSPVPGTFIGKGKIEELRLKALNKEFDTLIFDDELRPAQQKNLAEIIPAKVLDRTRLILDIFAKRARTREGILQVELAQLSYMLPRMTERYGRFEQQVGGIGTRGPGERKLEVEARHIRDRMAHLKKQIELVKMHREVARERRHSIPLPIVTIVGYTNAGKSTLLNALVRLCGGEPAEPIYADDKLFATLDPTTRRIKLPSGRWALFTDTVGFIKKLPHHLVAAFRSTLEETLNADLLVHLIDSGDENRYENARTVMEILGTMETERKLDNRVIAVYNKIDTVASAEKATITNRHKRFFRNTDVRIENNEPIFISSTKGAGIGKLLKYIDDKLSEQMIETKVHLNFRNMKLLPSLYHLGKVESIDHTSTGADLLIKLEKSHLSKLRKLLKESKAELPD